MNEKILDYYDLTLLAKIVLFMNPYWKKMAVLQLLTKQPL